MTSSFEVVSEHWPLVVSRLPARIEEKELEKFIATHDALLARRAPYVTLTDCTALREVPNPTVRKHIGEWNKRVEAQIRQYNVATAIVIGSPLIRGALTALHWVAPPPQPTEVVSSTYDGLLYLLGVLQKRGMTVPSSALDYRDRLAYDSRKVANR